jgi:hypothetical protein
MSLGRSTGPGSWPDKASEQATIPQKEKNRLMQFQKRWQILSLARPGRPTEQLPGDEQTGEKLTQLRSILACQVQWSEGLP